MIRNDLRNVAIIAHVDHGKTTLVDQMLKQSGLFRESELSQECILDSNPLERQRGITILAKNIAFKLGDVKINLIDTPGHADFGGEVERVLKMADGCFLLVDAAEGPLPQTRFVLRKAFAARLKPIAVGKVFAGKIRKNQRVALLKRHGQRVDDTVVQLMEFNLLGRKEVEVVEAGDICAVVGLDDAEIGDTIADFETAVALPPITVDEPTLDMVFRVNDSPFAGQDGTPITSRQLRDRLWKEMD